jgi:hypothetical protein
LPATKHKLISKQINTGTSRVQPLVGAARNLDADDDMLTKNLSSRARLQAEQARSPVLIRSWSKSDDSSAVAGMSISIEGYTDFGTDRRAVNDQEGIEIVPRSDISPASAAVISPSNPVSQSYFDRWMFNTSEYTELQIPDSLPFTHHLNDMQLPPMRC